MLRLTDYYNFVDAFLGLPMLLQELDDMPKVLH
jgi:hypothetical protein